MLSKLESTKCSIISHTYSPSVVTLMTLHLEPESMVIKLNKYLICSSLKNKIIACIKNEKRNVDGELVYNNI